MNLIIIKSLMKLLLPARTHTHTVIRSFSPPVFPFSCVRSTHRLEITHVDDLSPYRTCKPTSRPLLRANSSLAIGLSRTYDLTQRRARALQCLLSRSHNELGIYVQFAYRDIAVYASEINLGAVNINVSLSKGYLRYFVYICVLRVCRAGI